MRTLFVRPKSAGTIVRDPVTHEALSAEGARKPASTYWLRRLADGDVVEVPEPKALSVPPAPATAEKTK